MEATTTIIARVNNVDIMGIMMETSKERMLLLPLEFAIGWIFSDEVREKAQGNIMQLHAALWDYIKNN